LQFYNVGAAAVFLLTEISGLDDHDLETEVAVGTQILDLTKRHVKMSAWSGKSMVDGPGGLSGVHTDGLFADARRPGDPRDGRPGVHASAGIDSILSPSPHAGGDVTSARDGSGGLGGPEGSVLAEVTVKITAEQRKELKSDLTSDRSSMLKNLMEKLKAEGGSEIPPSLLMDPDLKSLVVDSAKSFDKSTFALLTRLPAFVMMRRLLVSRIRAHIVQLFNMSTTRHVFQFCFLVDNSGSMGNDCVLT
jgi:hypothetical protein